MPCDEKPDADGKLVGFVCTGRGTRGFCVSCSRPSSKLCDWPIARRFGFPAEELHRSEVQTADLIVVVTEKRDLMRGHWRWPVQQTHRPMLERIEPLAAEAAEELFLARFFEVRP